jgi:hypothetical protein
MTTETKEPTNTQKCAYCGKVKPLNEVHLHRLITRGRKWDMHRRRDVACVVEQMNWYCNGTSCDINDQMGHEG